MILCYNFIHFILQRYREFTVKKLFKIICLAEFLNNLKGVFAKNERGYRLNAIKKRF